MILLVSNTGDATSNYFEQRAEERGVPITRLNTDVLAAVSVQFQVSGGTVAGRLKLGGQNIAIEEITSIYYRRPVLPDVPSSDVAQGQWTQNEIRCTWAGILHSLRSVRWVNHPLAISAAAYKPEQLVRASRFGLCVPPTILTNDPLEALIFCRYHDWQIVVKPVGHGELRGESREDDRLVYTTALPEMTAEDLDDVRNCATLFQRRIPKMADIRVTIVGEECLAVSMVQPAGRSVDIRRDNMRGVRYEVHHLPSAVRSLLVQLVRSYDLVFGAIDLVLDESGTYWYLELNPAGQWAWLEEHTQVPISSALLAVLR